MFISFLRKYYRLSAFTPQANNYVVFHDFFVGGRDDDILPLPEAAEAEAAPAPGGPSPSPSHPALADLRTSLSVSATAAAALPSPPSAVRPASAYSPFATTEGTGAFPLTPSAAASALASVGGLPPSRQSAPPSRGGPPTPAPPAYSALADAWIPHHHRAHIDPKQTFVLSPSTPVPGTPQTQQHHHHHLPSPHAVLHHGGAPHPSPHHPQQVHAVYGDYATYSGATKSVAHVDGRRFVDAAPTPVRVITPVPAHERPHTTTGSPRSTIAGWKEAHGVGEPANQVNFGQRPHDTTFRPHSHHVLVAEAGAAADHVTTLLSAPRHGPATPGRGGGGGGGNSGGAGAGFGAGAGPSSSSSSPSRDTHRAHHHQPPSADPAAGAGTLVDAIRGLSLTRGGGGAPLASSQSGSGVTGPYRRVLEQQVGLGTLPHGVSPGGPTFLPPGRSVTSPLDPHNVEDRTAQAAHRRLERVLGRQRDPHLEAHLSTHLHGGHDHGRAHLHGGGEESGAWGGGGQSGGGAGVPSPSPNGGRGERHHYQQHYVSPSKLHDRPY
jgi:hypothetical protein